MILITILNAGFDKPSFVYDHSDDQQQKDLILLNYCIDDIEAMCKVKILVKNRMKLLMIILTGSPICSIKCWWNRQWPESWEASRAI